MTPVPTVTSIATVALSSTVRVSIFAVPSMNKLPHSLVAAPIFLLPSTSGIKLLPTDVNVDTPLTSNLLVVVTPVILTPNWSMTLTLVPSSSSRVILSPAILKSPTVSLI